MEITAEDTHTGFMSQITGKRARRKVDGMWVTPRAEVVQEAAGNQSEMTYIGIRQGVVAQWVVMRPIFEACTRETGYEGGEHRRDA